MTDSPTGHNVLILDGAAATELRRAGMSISPPWWSTRALLTDANRQVLRTLHEGYIRAGARVCTTNTFRSNLRALNQTRLDGAGQAWMVHAAVGVAAAAHHETGGDPDVLLAGSIGPAEDCYRPDLVPSDDDLRAEHGWLVQQLSRSGVRLYLIETMNTVREARIALEQVSAADGRAWVSFACADGARLLSGERLIDAVRAVTADGAEAVLVNCTSPEQTETCLATLRESWSGVLGAYPNIEDRSAVAEGGHVDEPIPSALGPEEFAELMAGWRADYDLRILGGCCGASPAHVSALSRLLVDAAV
jgi:S-methylmethionine-dependent homocysteine/selenocysteine methylase